MRLFFARYLRHHHLIGRLRASGYRPGDGIASRAGTESEDDTTNPAPESGKPDKPEKHLSLLDAAIEVLQRCPAGTALNTRDMVKEATAQQQWIPIACQTPEQTLYGAIFRENKTKEQPRIVKADAKGKFRLA